MKVNLKNAQNIPVEKMEMAMEGFKTLAKEAGRINLSYFSDKNNVDHSVNSINKFAKEMVGIEVSTEFIPHHDSVVFNITRENHPSNTMVIIELVEEEEPSETYNWRVKYFDFQNVNDEEKEEMLNASEDALEDLSEMSFDEVLSLLEEVVEEINKCASEQFYYEVEPERKTIIGHVSWIEEGIAKSCSFELTLVEE